METTFAKNLNRLRIILIILSVMNIFPCMLWFMYKTNIMKQSLTVEDGIKTLTAALLCPFNLFIFDLAYHPKARIFITGPIVVATLVLYIKHLVQGSAFGFDGICAPEKVACIFDYLNTFWALTVAVLTVVEFFLVSHFDPDDYGRPRQRCWRRTRACPSPPLSTHPTPVAPLQQLQLQQPTQEQKEPEQHEPQQSILSSVTTLKDEEAKSEKSFAERHSAINIDTLDDNDLELGLYLEQPNIPNPTSFNPRSMPNKGL